MAEHLHHVHIFASDIDATIAWWREMLGAEVAVDTELAGARNVFLKVGTGRLHLYDQPPKGQPGGAVHHIGIRSDDLPALVERMRAKGAQFRSEIREFGTWRYVMAAAPDGVLLELFAADAHALSGPLADYFEA
jgi:catechol 2,3-dioxygenase-like lactoylglutathione lyase family enzyme